MSTLNTVNITNGTDSITVEGAVKGSAKAWVNFNGTGTVAIRASYNVSSITDNGVGTYTLNFTNALADANYSVVFAGSDSNYGSVVTIAYSGVYSTTQTGIRIASNVSPVDSDIAYICIAIFR